MTPEQVERLRLSLACYGCGTTGDPLARLFTTSNGGFHPTVWCSKCPNQGWRFGGSAA